MDVVSAISGYISKMVSAGDTTTGSSSKMKILLLDSETVRVLESNLFDLELMMLGIYRVHRHNSIRFAQS